jgi:hypothetical protein
MDELYHRGGRTSTGIPAGACDCRRETTRLDNGANFLARVDRLQSSRGFYKPVNT